MSFQLFELIQGINCRRTFDRKVFDITESHNKLNSINIKISLKNLKTV